MNKEVLMANHENTVAVGIDGSLASKAALEWAVAQAKARGAKLQLVCAYEMPSYASELLPNAAMFPVSDQGLMYRAAEKMVKEAAASVADSGLEVTWTLEFGDPTEILVELSKKVALIVVGGRESQTGKLADRLLRTVSSAVPSNAYCPTVVVPVNDAPVALPIKTIVVGVDGSKFAQTAMQRAVWEADRWNAKLIVVACVNTAAATWVPEGTFQESFLVEVEESVRDQLLEVDEGRDIDVHVHAVEGNPAQILTEFSSEVDLLIVGTRGRGGFTGLLLGSTSQNVLQETRCATMVVPRRIRPGDDEGPQLETRLED